jgi:hypothetical protein
MGPSSGRGTRVHSAYHLPFAASIVEWISLAVKSCPVAQGGGSGAAVVGEQGSSNSVPRG